MGVSSNFVTGFRARGRRTTPKTWNVELESRNCRPAVCGGSPRVLQDRPRMSLIRALAIACLLVLPGVLLRVVPHVHVLIAGSAAPESTTVSSDAESPGDESSHIPAQVPRRLVQRPRLLLALGFALEVGLHVALILALLRSATMASLFTALPRAGRTAATLFFTALLAGFLGGYDATFPFIPWRMYSGQGAANPTVYLLDGETRAGSSVRLDLQGLVPAVGQRRLRLIVQKQARAISTTDSSSAEQERLRSMQRLTLLALARLHNAKHPDDPLTRITLTRAVVPLDATQPPWLRDQREIISLDIDPQLQ